MIKSFAIPSFFSFYFGAALAFWINIDSDNIAIMSAALIAALLTYYNSLVSLHNKGKDYREKNVESLVEKGREFIKKCDNIEDEAMAHIHFKKEQDELMDGYDDSYISYEKALAAIENKEISAEEKKEKTEKVNKAFNVYRDARRPEYVKAIDDHNEKINFFHALEYACENSGEVFLDDVSIIDVFYLDKSKKSVAADKIVKSALESVSNIKKNALERNVYEFDFKNLGFLYHELSELRGFLNDIKTECILELTYIDRKNNREKELVFVLTISIFLMGAGFMVSNGFKI